MHLLFISLSHAEAADTSLMANVEALAKRIRLEGVAVTTSIGPDAPNVGAPAPFSPPQPPALETASLGFGVPGAAGAVPSSTAPAALPASLPIPPAGTTTPAAAPVSAAPAPSAPAAPTTSASGVQLDAEGLPWDARLHSSSKKLNENGTWRARKNLNDHAMVARVKAELLAAMQAPAAAPAMPPPPATLAPEVFQQQQAAASAAAMIPPLAPTPAPAPAALVPPPVVQPPAAPPAPDLGAAQGLMMFLAPHLASGLLTQERQNKVFAHFGLKGLPDVMARPDLAPKLRETFEAWIPYWQANPAAV